MNKLKNARDLIDKVVSVLDSAIDNDKIYLRGFIVKEIKALEKIRANIYQLDEMIKEIKESTNEK